MQRVLPLKVCRQLCVPYYYIQLESIVLPNHTNLIFVSICLHGKVGAAVRSHGHQGQGLIEPKADAEPAYGAPFKKAGAES